jgi:hypothetical protein
MPYARFAAWLLAGLIPLAAAAAEPLPSLSELESAGAVIGDIRVDTDNIFDLDNPREDNFLFRAANALHIKTRPWLIRRLLLFKSGERLSRRRIDETERLIRANSSVYDVAIRPVRYENGVVDLEVRTRDTWTLQPSVKLSRSGGATTGGFSVKESNLAGTGTMLDLSRAKDVDRTGTQIGLSHQHLFDGWTSIAASRARFSDGSSTALSVDRPFYALETTWAAGASAGSFDRSDSLYQNGNVVGRFRHRQHAGQAYAGWSPGLVDGWTHRYSAGLSYSEDRYAADPTEPPPAPIPADRTLAGPFVRYEVVEDDYLQVENRDRIRRPEYLAMGFQSSVQLGRSLGAFGATDDPWQVAVSVSKGFRAPANGQVFASMSYSAQYGSSVGDVRSLGVATRYFAPQTGGLLLYLAASANTVKTPNFSDEILLGGDNGLRGYPLRYQRGTRSALFTVEERYYSDLYLFQLFRVGAAVYYDLGRAWGSQLPNATPGWLSDVGFGLRFLNARTSFGNVLHIDIALPVHRTDAGIKRGQLLIVTAQTF